MSKLLAIIVVVFLLYECTDRDPPNELPLSQYEDLYVHVWFYFPDGEKGYNLGR